MSGQPAKATLARRRVVVVDDHPLVRAGLQKLLTTTEDLEICGEADSVGEGIALVRQVRPDLVVTDLGLKDGSGFELIRQIRGLEFRVPLLVFSMYEEHLYAERALRAGASGYVSKDECFDTLLGAMRRVLKGQVYLSKNMNDRILVGMIREDASGDPVGALSNRELQILELISEGKTTKVIAEELHLSPKTIETHRMRIRNKLNLASSQELTRYAVRWGATVTHRRAPLERN